MGGRALRTALESPRFDVVGVKVFSPHKHGRDIGELAGLGPVGVTATTSKAEILALEADCVVHTPTTPALVQGADADVLDLLESGKNVVSAASYHSPAMPTWLSETRAPLEVLRTVAQMRVTGLGFGMPLSAVDSNHAIALMQHFYFDAVLANVGHALFGVGADQVRVERHVYPVPARVRMEAGGSVIEPGSVGAIHMSYRGYIGDRLFMTNAECWHVGMGNAHLGPDHPRSLAGGHVITLDGSRARIEMRNELDDETNSGDWSAVTDISVKAMLDVIPELCLAPPGVATPDLSPRFRLETA
ncbi:hypothetical protein [Nocardia jiangxiensis]|uniref:Dihydrodipicolinate reductase n=1 Tax=Nocardia jiangxiensis TaxID=282685 RepID=A0ABW6S718_9NOCA|nr:hypothetical protein [Nocardia jiangxiensis]